MLDIRAKRDKKNDRKKTPVSAPELRGKGGTISAFAGGRVVERVEWIKRDLRTALFHSKQDKI